MKWLVQESLNNPSNVVRMMIALGKTETAYLLVRLNKNHTLTVLDQETKLPLDDSDFVLNEFIQDDKIMVYGSKAFAELAQKMELYPGSFWNENFDFAVLKKQLGEELLNHDLTIGELFNFQPSDDLFIIRPTGNTKLFAGMTVSKDDFLIWQERERMLGEKSSYAGKTLMISSLKKIQAEFRFFVVDQTIVTSSSYRINGEFDTSRKHSDEMMAYTKRIVERFPLSKAFVIDIALTDAGYKVVEYNNINCSGLYDCDELAIVRAINHLC
ncbi:ATP-grasp domain-containing protein [Paenibacillus sp. BSR1-1]|uniref:ATP-grasp domain-containing protein n=1 Tax=Paenibacillus sp. BSR1-1 TaxID=3020845 RepID=UPI0025AFD3DA|nr:ATP-grasp domain-containing protein [Paenibacillus sp. BSR1-1]MDN3019924.1 ATP-grasp domain-containing protein [Paenibacillus sp. BSR1-1]